MFKDQADPYGRGSYCIVVALYGSESREAEILRSFRDCFLARLPKGQNLINLYYRISPTIVSVTESSKIVSSLVSALISLSARILSFYRP